MESGLHVCVIDYACFKANTGQLLMPSPLSCIFVIVELDLYMYEVLLQVKHLILSGWPENVPNCRNIVFVMDGRVLWGMELLVPLQVHKYIANSWNNYSLGNDNSLILVYLLMLISHILVLILVLLFFGLSKLSFNYQNVYTVKNGVYNIHSWVYHMPV